MNILFRNAAVTDEAAPGHMKRVCLATDGATISYIGEKEPVGDFDRTVDCSGMLMIPGLVNAHCHSAMTLLRGLGGGLSLKSWLDDAILPAEDRLTPELTGLASMWAIAEMIAGGITSFSDMYFFCEATAEAAYQAGIRANIARSVVSFGENGDYREDSRVKEAVALYDEWNGVGGIKVDFSLHAEYTNKPGMCEYLACVAAERNTGLQIHLSETASEHCRCLEKYSKTPARFFDDLGALNERTSLVHCVHVTPEDIELIAGRHASVVHCPRSNLKLGSGVAPLREMLDAGINVSLGTDGAASNNRLSVLGEYNTAAILHPGVTGRADILSPAELLPLLSRAGALSQGRADTGELAVGMKADICLLDMSGAGAAPVPDAADYLAYTADASQVRMTVCDGRILYENGEYTTIDMERLRHGFHEAAAKFYGGN